MTFNKRIKLSQTPAGCGRPAEPMIDWADGALDDAARADAARHAGQCGDCASLADFQRRLRDELHTAASPLPQPEYFEDVLHQVNRRRQGLPGMSEADVFAPRRRSWLARLFGALCLWRR